MSDLFYRSIRLLGGHVFFASARPVILGRHHTDRPGGYLLASNHSAPYDMPLLIRHCVRPIDFVSIHEVFNRPFNRWFYGSMNAFPIDRNRPDPKSVRYIIDRLQSGRVLGIFPEGRMQQGDASVCLGGKMRSGVGRLAHLAGVPIIPATLVGSASYHRPTAWLPLRRTRYGVAFGEPIDPRQDPDAIEAQWRAAQEKLYQQLVDALH